MGLYDYTFYDLINRNAVAYANRDAWFEADDGRSLSFLDLKRQVDRLACGLQQSGIVKGDRLGVLALNSLEYFLLYGAAAALGAVVLPINWRLSPEEAVFNLNDCQPKAVFADPQFEALIDDARDRLASVEACYGLKPGKGRFAAISTLMDNDSRFDPAEVSGDHPLVIIHTAAVAGRPRGAMLSHGNLLCADIHLMELFRAVAGEAHLNLLPMFHVAGLFMATAGFHAGLLTVNMSRFDAEKAVSLIARKNVSVIFDFSPILGALLDTQKNSGDDIGSLRSVLGLEAPETIERYQKLTGGTFYCMYGQTETSALATTGRYDDAPGSAGKPLMLADVRCVDDNDLPVAVGQTGEIVMRGPMVFKGYWNLPAENARVFRNGWHHTGDLGRFDADGVLWYEGRKADKELIKPGGENVYPAEVEKVILAHPAVKSTVVFGVPDPKWKEGIKAVCLLEPGAELSAEALVTFVAGRIASYKKPQYVEFVADLPLTEDGSVDRVKVKQTYGGPQDPH